MTNALLKPVTLLMNKLTYVQQLTLIGLFTLAAMAILLLLLINSPFQEIAFSEKELEGMRYLQPLMSLIYDVQILRRDIENTALMPKQQQNLASAKESIQKTIQEINTLTAALNNDSSTATDWNRLKTEWQQISQDSSSGQYNRYTAFIKNLIDFSINVNDRSNLTLDPAVDTSYLMDSYSSKLPNLIEEAFLIYAMGSDYLKNGGSAHIDSASRLLESIILMSKSRRPAILRNLKKIAQVQPQETEELRKATLAVMGEQFELVDRLNYQLLQNSRDISPSEFASAYSDFIAASYALEVQMGKLLENLLKKRIAILRPLLISSMLMAVLVLSSLFYLFVGLAKSLADKEKKAHAIFDSTADAIVLFNQDDLVEMGNKAAGNLFKTPSNLLVGQKLTNLLTPATDMRQNSFFMADENILQEGYVGYSPENGVPVEFTISKIKSTQDQHSKICNIRDISARKKIEKMKNAFIAIVSHELKTPLTSINGAVNLLMGRFITQLSDKGQHLLNIASSNCERLILIIDDILDMNKLEEGKLTFTFKEMNMRTLIEESVRINEQYAKKFNVHIQNHCHTDCLLVADYDRLIQVVTNLLSNAVKFSFEHAPVSVYMNITPQTVQVSIKNTGKGIPKEAHAKIFDRFFQANSSTTRGISGTGLGLSICKAIVESHKGTIYFTSTEGKETVFTFELPLPNKHTT